MGYHAELKYAVREIGLWPEHLGKTTMGMAAASLPSPPLSAPPSIELFRFWSE